MADALRTYSTRRTPQTRPANPRQSRNRAGGYTFTVTPQTALRRFLILGVDSGTYYARPPELAAQNAELLLQYATDDHRGLVDTIVDVSTSGAAPKPNPALFALAVAASHGTTDEKTYALAQLPRVARTGTHLFTFSRYVEQFRGWGRGLRRGVAAWIPGGNQKSRGAKRPPGPGKQRLGATTKMGERSLRRLLIIGANSVIIKRHVHREAQPGTWLGNMLSRKPSMLVRVALANKMARIVWALMARGGVYQSPAVAA